MRQFCTPNIDQPAQHSHNLCHSQQLQKSLQVKVAVSICQTAQYEKSWGIILHSSIFIQHPTAMARGQTISPFFTAHSQVIPIHTTSSQSLPGYFHEGTAFFSADHTELDATDFFFSFFIYRSFLLARARDHFTRPTDRGERLSAGELE